MSVTKPALYGFASIRVILELSDEKICFLAGLCQRACSGIDSERNVTRGGSRGSPGRPEMHITRATSSALASISGASVIAFRARGRRSTVPLAQVSASGSCRRRLGARLTRETRRVRGSAGGRRPAASAPTLAKALDHDFRTGSVRPLADQRCASVSGEGERRGRCRHVARRLSELWRPKKISDLDKHLRSLGPVLKKL